MAGSDQNKLFINAFNASGREEGGALDLAHSLFRPRTPEQVAAAALPKQQALGAIQAQAADLRQTPGERQTLVQKGAANQAKLDAAGREIYDPNDTARNIGRTVNDFWQSASDDTVHKAIGVPIGNAAKSLWNGLTGGSPTVTPASHPLDDLTSPATPALGAQPATPAVKPPGTAAFPPVAQPATPAAPAINSKGNTATAADPFHGIGSAMDPEELMRRRLRAQGGKSPLAFASSFAA